MRILHQHSTDALLALSLTVFICSTGWRGTSSASQAQAKGTRHRIAFNRIGPIRTGLFIADADRRVQHRLKFHRLGCLGKSHSLFRFPAHATSII